MGRKQKTLTFTLTHNESGQSIRGRFVPYSQGGKFVKLWQDTMWKDRIFALRGESIKVLWYLLETAKWGNEAKNPGEAAKALGLLQPNISRAYSELIKSNLLIKKDGVYSLNPFFCWMGSNEQYEKAVGFISTPLTKDALEIEGATP